MTLHDRDVTADPLMRPSGDLTIKVSTGRVGTASGHVASQNEPASRTHLLPSKRVHDVPLRSVSGGLEGKFAADGDPDTDHDPILYRANPIREE